VVLCQSVEHLLFLTFIHTIQYNHTFIHPLPFAFAEALFLVVSSSSGLLSSKPTKYQLSYAGAYPGYAASYPGYAAP
jgi:hypothetical protein